MHEPTMYRPGPQRTQPQQYFASDPVYMQHQSDTLPRMSVTCAIAAHTFPRSPPELTYAHPTVTSMLPCQPTGPGESAFVDNAVQRSQFDNSNVYTHSIEQLLADLPPPPHVYRQPMLPLSSVYTQTTANVYVNTDSTTSLPAQRYVDMPTYVNMSINSDASLSRPTGPGRSNVTDVTALYAHSYTFDLPSSSSLVTWEPDIAYARSSYADNSQPLPIAVEQPGLSAFSRVDVTQSRPVTVDPTVQYVVCTSVPSATADYLRPNATAPSAPLQSPSIHWKKRLSYDYIPPDTVAGAPIHVAPATQSVYIRPQTSVTYTDTHTTN